LKPHKTMAFKSYRPRLYEHTHENSFFRNLSTQLSKTFTHQEGLNILLGNISCNGNPIDSIFISKGKIIVIDFKNYGGKLTFSENNAWQIHNGKDFVFVKGGGGIKNPFQQVNEYRFSLINFLSKKQKEILEPNHDNINLGHISAMVLFHQPITFDDNEIPQKINKYFCITDYINCINVIEDRASNQLNFSDIEINNILSALDINEGNLFEDKPELVMRPDPDETIYFSHTNYRLLPIELKPNDDEKFKELLLINKQATITTFYKNGTFKSTIWKAFNMTANSNIKGNLRSRPEFRNGNWQKLNIAKVVVEVIDQPLVRETSSSVKITEINGNDKTISNRESVIGWNHPGEIKSYFKIDKKWYGQNKVITVKFKKGNYVDKIYKYDHDKVYDQTITHLKEMYCWKKNGSYSSTNNIPAFAINLVTEI
jgi:hypothetical protein